MSSKSKGKKVATEQDVGLVAKAKQLKVEATHESILKKAAFNAGMSVEKYSDYIKGLHKERFDQTEEKDSSVIAAEALETEMRQEEELALKEEQLRVQADQEMSKKIQKEQVRLDYIQSNFTKQRWDSPIIHLEGFMEKGKAVCRCLLQGNKTRTIRADKMHTLGFEEWKQIAKMCVRLKSEELQSIVKKEAVYNVNTAFYSKLVNEDEYREFCTANNCHRGARSLGLESQDEHPVPEGLKFEQRTYIKTETHEGLFYVDSSGAECFQDINSLFKTSLYHCIALMNECKSPQCHPFRLRLVSWLFNNLLRIEKIGGVEDKVEKIKREYQLMHNKTDEEMLRLMKWKKEKTDWVKSNLKQSIYPTPPKAKSKRRRK